MHLIWPVILSPGLPGRRTLRLFVCILHFAFLILHFAVVRR